MRLNLKHILLALLLSSVSLNAQTLNFRLSSYFYNWERVDSVAGEPKTSHMRGYQNLLLEANQKNWSFNTMTQIQEDLYNPIGKGFDYIFYNLYVKGSNLFDVLDLKLGRQYVFAGAGKGPMDGMNMKFKTGSKKEYQFSLFGGAVTPGDYDFESYPELNNNYIFGTTAGYFGADNGLTAMLSYFNKRRKYDPYYATRMDSSFNPVQELVVTDSRFQNLGGLDINFSRPQYFVYGKAYYDFYQDEFYNAEFNATYIIKNTRLSAGYIYREPRLTYNTTFWSLAQYWPLNQYQEVQASADYTLKNGINIFGKFSDVFYIDDSSLKFQIGFNHPQYGLSYILYSGYSGESNGATGYLYSELIKSKLSGNLTLNYSNYNIGDYSSENENAFSGLLGITYRPSPQVSFDLQGQFITNMIYEIDSRFLIGINYWLFTSL